MLTRLKTFFLTLLVVLLGCYDATAQTFSPPYGSTLNKKYGVHSGNLVKTVFSNAGVIGQPGNRGPRGAWIYDNNGYIGDISLLIGVEAAVPDSADRTNPLVGSKEVFRSVIMSDVARPGGRDQASNGDIWTFQPRPDYANPNQERIAMSNLKATWPEGWPDRVGDATDPGWRGSWNGYFGKNKFQADQESYFVMDDHPDYEFNQAPWKFKPDANDTTRHGMALEVKVRGLQWAQFLASDCIFWLYEITNVGTTNYEKAVFGLLCGTYIGVTGSDDSPAEYDDDVSFFDVKNSLVYSWDFPNDNRRNPNWVGRKVGYVGYAFLESPGNPFDGIDNDFDSPSFLNNAPETNNRFKPTDFDSVLVGGGAGRKEIIVINEDYTRVKYNLQDSINAGRTVALIKTKNLPMMTINLVSGTWLKEGNIVLRTISGVQIEETNANAYDSGDNDLDGLIDENYFVHYRQKKLDQLGNVLFDELVSAAYKNYFTGVGVNDAMIDERRDDLVDNNNNWDVLRGDVGLDGVDATGDLGEGDGQPSSGYSISAQGASGAQQVYKYDNTIIYVKDTGLPGEPGIDKTDVRESDQIGLTSFEYFSPSNNIQLFNDEDLWLRLRPGFFSVPNNFVNGKPVRGEDGDFTFGSGYFPMRAKQTERFSFALLYGEDLVDFYKNRKTVQKIYDANYQFPTPPDKPVIKLVGDDSKVTVYWGRESEETIDPVLGIKDFEGYKIYKSTDANFEDVRVITNADGVIDGYKPEAQFDIKNNGIKGYFQASGDLFQDARGLSFYLGDDESGIVHKYVDTEVENGQRYFYAVVAYDAGDASQDIFPSENTKFVQILSTGEIITDVNTGWVIPGKRAAGYDVPSSFAVTKLSGVATGSVSVQTVDDTQLKNNNTYRLTFEDRRTDGVDNNNNGKIDGKDLAELVQLTTNYSVQNTTGITELLIANDTLWVDLKQPGQHIKKSDMEVRLSSNNSVLNSTNYIVDERRGRIRGTTTGNMPKGTAYTVSYKPYNIYKSVYMPNNPEVVETLDDITVDGVSLLIQNNWSVAINQTLTRYKTIGQSDTLTTIQPNTNLYQPHPANRYLRTRFPYDYRIEFSNTTVAQSITDSSFYITNPNTGNSFVFSSIIRNRWVGRDVNFRVKNVTLNKYSKFTFYDSNTNGIINGGDQLVILEEVDTLYNIHPTGNPGTATNSLMNQWYGFRSGGTYYAYGFQFIFIPPNSNPGNNPITDPTQYFDLVVTKPFNSGDVFNFTTSKGVLQEATVVKNVMKNIKAVPNPYIGTHSHEPALPPNITSGRGERKMDFINLPNDAKVHIFTSAGEHVMTLTSDGSLFSGTLVWNLKTKENLDVAAGIYFYIVESSVGKVDGKIAIIK